MKLAESARPVSYWTFAGGLAGYLTFLLVTAWVMWESPWPVAAQVAVLLAPAVILGALLAVPWTRERGGPQLRGLTIGCLSGVFLVFVMAVVGQVSQR